MGTKRTKQHFVDVSYLLYWRRGGAVLARWSSDPKVGGSRPGLCHSVVSLDKKLYSTLSLSTQGPTQGHTQGPTQVYK